MVVVVPAKAVVVQPETRFVIVGVALQLGAVPVPPEMRTLPVATSASFP